MSKTTGWYADDGNAEVHFPDASSGREAAEEYVAEGDWGERTKTSWVRVYAWRGERGTDLAEETRETHTIEIEPDEPECSHDDGHDWQSPVEIVGGIESNPGVRGHGGGVVVDECCVRCGCRRTTDTWAQDRDTGEQGLTSVEYEEGAYAEELDRAVARALEGGPIPDGMEDYPVPCAYCAADVPLTDAVDVPDEDDDEEWAELADLHDDDCEWIETRAHRRELDA